MSNSMSQYMNKLLNQQSGLTLIEIMIAITLSAFITAGVVQLFASNKATYTIQNSIGRMQEDANLALSLISRDVRMAGNTGCNRSVPVVNNMLASNPDSFNPAIGIQGWEAVGTAPGKTYKLTTLGLPVSSTTGDDSDWTTRTGEETKAAPGINVLPGNDIIRIWRTSSSTPVRIQSVSNPGLGIQDITTSVPHQFKDKDILIASDCSNADWFQMCAGQGAGSTTIDLEGCSAPQVGNVGVISANGTFSEVNKLIAATYFIGKRDGDKNNPPTLFRAGLLLDGSAETGRQQEIAEGVESLQITYGADTNNDGAIDQYFTASKTDGVSDWSQVMNVKISLLMRSVTPAGGASTSATYDVNGTIIEPDITTGYPRRVYSTTVMLRNRTS